MTYPDSKVHGVNMGPTWGAQDPDGPHVGHVNLAIWDSYLNGAASEMRIYLNLAYFQTHILEIMLNYACLAVWCH